MLAILQAAQAKCSASSGNMHGASNGLLFSRWGNDANGFVVTFCRSPFVDTNIAPKLEIEDIKV